MYCDFEESLCLWSNMKGKSIFIVDIIDKEWNI